MSLPRLLHALWIWVPVALYVFIIFYLASQNELPFRTVTPDYLNHALEYFGLAILVVRSLNNGLMKGIPVNRLIVTFFLCVAVGGADEFWQWWWPGNTNRLADVMDVVADAVGAAVALGLLHLVARGRERKEEA